MLSGTIDEQLHRNCMYNAHTEQFMEEAAGGPRVKDVSLRTPHEVSHSAHMRLVAMLMMMGTIGGAMLMMVLLVAAC